MATRPVPRPSPAPGAGSPSGSTGTTAPCCPDVATFEGTTGPRSSYFGFDDKTNLVQNVGADEYWIPPTDPKAVPGNKEKRDGARWVSVGVGQEAATEINFAGTFTNACLLNCTYEVVPANIADITSPAITATGMTFKIKGKAVGEASLKVTCDGKVRGYFHIWCAQPAVIDLDIVTIKSSLATGGMPSLSALEQELDACFRQNVLTFDVQDLGDADITGNTAFVAAEAAMYTSGGFDYSLANIAALDGMASTILATRTPPQLLPRPAALRLYYYVPTTVNGSTVGSVITVGSSPAFTFDATPTISENTTAHELGHCLGLRHPSDGLGSAQYASHIRPTLGQAITAIPATNTEPAVSGQAGLSNVHAADPLNLMGYWINFGQAKPLRYNQWKTCRRTA